MPQAEDKSTLLQTVKLEGGPEFIQLLQVEISHAVNEFACAKVVLIVTKKVGEKFLKEADLKKIKITANNGEEVKLFHGCLVGLKLEELPEQILLTLELRDTSCMLNWKRASRSFQKLDAKYEDILKTVIGDAGTIKLEKVTDKAIEKIVLRLNETEWEFTRRMAGKLGAPIFTNIFSEKAAVTLGVPAPQKTLKLVYNQIVHTFNDAEFQFFEKNKKAKAESLNLVSEDFYSVHVGGCTEYLNLGDKVNVNNKDYFVKKVSARFVENVLIASYELVGKTTAFFMPVIPQKNIAGRVFRAQVKKVEKDKVQVHLIDIDEQYEEGTALFPFATAYSSQDGSGWYAMPEVDDYVRVLFPSQDTGDAFALSSINTAPLKEPKNKSIKAPGGREILLTDKGIEIIAEHEKTFIKIDKGDGISMVSAKNIVINANGNVNFDAKGKIQLVSAKEITAQSGQSHVKILSNQIAVGGSNVIVGE